jgi:hypothetical protein
MVKYWSVRSQLTWNLDSIPTSPDDYFGRLAKLINQLEAKTSCPSDGMRDPFHSSRPVISAQIWRHDGLLAGATTIKMSSR